MPALKLVAFMLLGSISASTLAADAAERKFMRAGMGEGAVLLDHAYLACRRGDAR